MSCRAARDVHVREYVRMRPFRPTQQPGPATRLAPVAGFTLVEIVIVIIVLGIMAGIAIPVIGTFLGDSRTTATRDEMRRIAVAIAGDRAQRGFEGDVGSPPSSLADLVRKPDSIAAWDPFLDVGWNGPYLDSTNTDYARDAWDSVYVYDPGARTLVSVGSGANITITF